MIALIGSFLGVAACAVMKRKLMLILESIADKDRLMKK